MKWTNVHENDFYRKKKKRIESEGVFARTEMSKTLIFIIKTSMNYSIIYPSTSLLLQNIGRKTYSMRNKTHKIEKLKQIIWLAIIICNSIAILAERTTAENWGYILDIFSLRKLMYYYQKNSILFISKLKLLW